MLSSQRFFFGSTENSATLKSCNNIKYLTTPLSRYLTATLPALILHHSECPLLKQQGCIRKNPPFCKASAATSTEKAASSLVKGGNSPHPPFLSTQRRIYLQLELSTAHISEMNPNSYTITTSFPIKAMKTLHFNQLL